MSDATATVATVPTEALRTGLDADALIALIASKATVQRDAADRWGITLIVAREHLRALVQFLRDDAALRFDTLLDVVGVDYLAYPEHANARFSVQYLFKSTLLRHRLRLKVWVEEDDCSVPSIHDLYKIADWSERETWDQYGIVFAGHPNLKRLLNHHEFSGHPLRKDYPCQKRQKLSVNDPMIDQLEARLRQHGYVFSKGPELIPGAPITETAKRAGGQVAGAQS